MGVVSVPESTIDHALIPAATEIPLKRMIKGGGPGVLRSLLAAHSFVRMRDRVGARSRCRGVSGMSRMRKWSGRG